MTTPTQPEQEVSLQSAYAAAVDRARKNQDALILAEAQSLDLRRQLDLMADENRDLLKRVEELQRFLKSDEPDAAAVD